jgi:hypothetical protein
VDRNNAAGLVDVEFLSELLAGQGLGYSPAFLAGVVGQKVSCPVRNEIF